MGGGGVGRQVNSHFPKHCSNSQGDQLAFKDGFVRDPSTLSSPPPLIPPGGAEGKVAVSWDNSFLPQDAGSPPRNNVPWTLAIFLDAQHMFLLFSGKITWVFGRGAGGSFLSLYVQSWWGRQYR